MNVAVFQDWSYEQIRARVVEAAETLLASPADLGPRMKLGSFSEVVQAYNDAYGSAPAGFRRIPAAGAISRMEETWTWINTYLGEADRKLLYDYGFIKSRKGMYLERYLERNDMVRRTFERKIQRCCQTIASALNRKHLVRLDIRLDGLSQNSVEDASTTVMSEKRDHGPAHWIAPGSKPQIDPALATTRVIKPQDIRARHSDRNRSLGAKA